MRAGDVLSDLGRPVVFHANLARTLGSIPAALMLAQLIYWSDKGADGGWVYKVSADWDGELALAPAQVKAARSILVGIGVVEHARRGIPAMPYYRLDLDRLDEWWSASMADSRPSCQAKIAHQGERLGPVIPIHAEMTTETTLARSEAFGVFWSAYPARDGKKNGKGKAELYWNKLTTDESAQAIIGAKNLTAALAAGGKFGPPDAWRWLRDRSWNDWQTPPARATRPVSYDAPKVIYR